MASLREHFKSQFWIACFTGPDGIRTQRSTRIPVAAISNSNLKALEKDLTKVIGAEVTIKGDPNATKSLNAKDTRKIAQIIADHFEEMARAGATARLTDGQARKVIKDIYEKATGKPLTSTTLKDFLDDWLIRKELEAGDKTHAKYSSVVTQFKEFLGSKAMWDISQITAADIVKFRDDLAKRVTAGTVNVSIKILRSAFAQAHRDSLIDVNEAERVTLLKRKAKDRFERRAFTMDELKRIIEAATDEWKGMIMFGLYTGQRLGDIASLTWNNIDLQRSELRLVTEKTGRKQIIPMAPPLVRFIEKLSATDDPAAPLFPKTHATAERHKHAGNLSNQFYAILVSAGMAKKKSHKADPKKPKGRSSRREQNEVSFHSLRHTATTLLKSAGVSDAVAMEFIGHDSKSVSHAYTHIPTEMLKVAAEKMPDVTQ